MIEARDADQAACPFIARCVPVRRCRLADTVRVDSMVPPAPHHRRHGRIKRADRILRSEGGRSTWTSPRCIRPRQHSPHPRCFARINLATTAEDAIAMQFKPRKRRGSPSLRTCIATLRRLPDQGHDARYRAAANVLQRQVDPASLGIHFHSVGCSMDESLIQRDQTITTEPDCRHRSRFRADVCTARLRVEGHNVRVFAYRCAVQDRETRKIQEQQPRIPRAAYQRQPSTISQPQAVRITAVREPMPSQDAKSLRIDRHQLVFRLHGNVHSEHCHSRHRGLCDPAGDCGQHR